MDVVRYRQTATLLPDGNVLVAGGSRRVRGADKLTQGRASVSDMPSRQTVTAHFERAPHDRWFVDVPRLGRSGIARSLEDGSIDQADAERIVRDLVVLWAGWDHDSFDVVLASATGPTLRM